MPTARIRATFDLRCVAARRRSLALYQRLAFMRGEEVVHIIGMFFLDAQDALQHCPGAAIAVAEIADQLAVMIDRNALGDQIFLDHVHQIFAFDILRGRAGQRPLGIEVGLAAQLIDAFGNLSPTECIKRRRPFGPPSFADCTNGSELAL